MVTHGAAAPLRKPYGMLGYGAVFRELCFQPRLHSKWETIKCICECASLQLYDFTSNDRHILTSNIDQRTKCCLLSGKLFKVRIESLFVELKKYSVLNSANDEIMISSAHVNTQEFNKVICSAVPTDGLYAPSDDGPVLLHVLCGDGADPRYRPLLWTGSGKSWHHCCQFVFSLPLAVYLRTPSQGTRATLLDTYIKMVTFVHITVDVWSILIFNTSYCLFQVLPVLALYLYIARTVCRDLHLTVTCRILKVWKTLLSVLVNLCLIECICLCLYVFVWVLWVYIKFVCVCR